PEEINNYLELFRSRYNLDEILQILDKMANLNVLVIGDTIIDDYQYCKAIGISSKDPALVVKYNSHDIFAGGVIAVANHVANFAKSVKLVTVLGERDSYEDFIKSQLKSTISFKFATQPNSPTIVKRRFIDGYSFNKLFEVYVMDDTGLPKEKDIELQNYIKNEISNYDLVIAADFGHGAISKDMVSFLETYSPFLSVNTQANAGNRGFHTISRYSRADYACIAEHELMLEMRTQNINLRQEMMNIRNKLGCYQFVVTRGRNGCAICDKYGEFVHVPAFAQKVVDRVGAGDAFLSVASLASSQKVPNEILCFIGNVVGALAVEIIGNKKSIDKLSVKKYIVSLLK
ncbi:MAG: cytidyltransferase, partial [Desulfobacterales bacterium]|nr:cytidyltransferase [Desulfobacterales bacterium]